MVANLFPCNEGLEAGETEEALVPKEASVSHGFASSLAIKIVGEFSIIAPRRPVVIRELVFVLIEADLQE